MRAEVHVESGDETRREVVLGCAHRDPRRDRCDRLVPDPFVDDVCGVPELRDLEPGPVAEAFERFRNRLPRDAVEGQRERIDRRGDEVRTGVDGSERRCEADTRRALDVEADGKAARLLDPGDELLRLVRQECARRVVHDDPGGAELGQLARLLDEHVGLARAARAVDEPRVERATGARDRRARLAQVRDVVERVVEPEDVDAVLGRARDEAPHDVAADGPRADEEASTQRDSERRRHARLDRANPLPRALDPATHGRVEDASSGHLQAGEARAVEDLRDAQDFRRRQLPGERLLREQADRRVDQLRHSPGPYRGVGGGEVRRGRCSDPRAGRP